jgi:hypothetical protein
VQWREPLLQQQPSLLKINGINRISADMAEAWESAHYLGEVVVTPNQGHNECKWYSISRQSSAYFYQQKVKKVAPEERRQLQPVEKPVMI